MRIFLTSAIALCVFTIGGCNNAKSPEAVEKDVAKAEQRASKEVASSEKDASKDLQSAADKAGDKLVDLNNTAVKDAYNIAVAKADGDRKVALANCNSMSGDAQKLCKDQADADYNAARANAKAAAQSDKQ